jgi:hypothetical protein
MRHLMRRLAAIWGVAGSITLLLIAHAWAGRQRPDDLEHEAIQYLSRPTRDPIALLQKRIDAGQVTLPYYERHGYLRAVLNALKIPAESQTLVFSKTSFQRERIAPGTPRALYFNDQTYIGWVQGGGVLEISTVDPELGAVFYVLEQRKTARPRFLRQTYECLQCHQSGMTQQVPGHILRSVFARADGQPDFRAGTFLTTDQSPMHERWGGWYITGTHGTMRHMGNAFAKGAEDVILNREEGANVTDLKKWFDVQPYLSAHSDIVAMLVMQHQINLHNLITRAGYQTRIALHYDDSLNKELGRPANYRSESVARRIEAACEPLLQGLLFAKEATFSAPIQGTSGFAAAFARRGPFDTAGRSLRQFDLRRRLFRYPCSFLIYAPEFDALPAPAKEYLYRRLKEILTGKDLSREFAHLSEADRIALRDILRDTKPDFASCLARP